VKKENETASVYWPQKWGWLPQAYKQVLLIQYWIFI